jgi:hypothetical protein
MVVSPPKGRGFRAGATLPGDRHLAGGDQQGRSRAGAALLLAVLVAGLAAVCAATALVLASGEVRGAAAWTAAARADAAVRSGLEREMAGETTPDRSNAFRVAVRRAGLRGDWVLLSARADSAAGSDAVPLRRGESALVRSLADTLGRPRLAWLGSGLDFVGWPP